MANEFIIKHGFQSKGNSNITGSLDVSGGVTVAGAALGLNPKSTHITTAAITASGTTVPLAQGLTYESASISNGTPNEFLEVFINGERQRYNIDFIPISNSTIRYEVTIPVGAEVTYKSLKRP